MLSREIIVFPREMLVLPREMVLYSRKCFFFLGRERLCSLGKWLCFQGDACASRGERCLCS